MCRQDLASSKKTESVTSLNKNDQQQQQQQQAMASTTKENTSKNIPSGFERRKTLIEIGILFLSVLYGCVYYLNPNIKASPSYCNEEATEGCLRPDLLAYKATSLVAMATMGLMGVYNWHFTSAIRKLAKGKPEDRLFNRNLAAADYQNVVIFCYQAWDIVVSLSIPEHVDPIFLTHHVLALITAYCSLEYQMVPYYSIFYGGCSEFSSIFLIFLGKDEMFPVTPGGFMETWVNVCRGMFFLSFSYYRIFGWIYYSVPLWNDCQSVITSGSCERHRPGKAYFLRMFQALDLLLGLLQCYWYYEILVALSALLS